MTLEISADGMPALIPDVRRIVAAAPEMPGWRVVVFRQPSPAVTIEMGDVGLDAEAIRFVVQSRGERLGLDIFMEGVTPENEDGMFEVLNILLHHVIGEYAVITRLGRLVVSPLALAPAGHRALSELRGEIEGVG